MKTPTTMRTISYFLLNELLWNFLGNSLFTFASAVPMMPAVCFRIEGMAASFLQTDERRLLYFMVIVLSVFNCTVGFITTFLFRYVTLAFSDTISRFHKALGFACCFICHIILSLIIGFLVYFWWLPSSKYPKNNLPDNVDNIFCFHPNGTITTVVQYFFMAWFAFTICLISLFAILSIREVRLKRHLMKKKTLTLQKEVLKNLQIITATAVIVGGLPPLVIVYYLCNSKLPFAREITAVLMLVTLNFGTVYAVLILALFKSYRQAVTNITRSFTNVLQALVDEGHTTSITSSDMYLHM
uniref:G_PROTEIN_RECEP_F1_2 domain-containing protein n=1 Tax=Steinernema glaseri TaxID=37863 RepID=A0A1I7YNT3_9BILA